MSSEERIAALEKRLALLEAKDGIRYAMTRYARGLDTEDWQMLGSAFARDAVLRGGWRKGTFKGRDTIIRLFQDQRSKMKYAQRISCNEQIFVDGDKATAISDSWFKYSVAEESYLGGGSGTYNWEFGIEDGVWVITRFHIIVRWLTTLKRGWPESLEPDMGIPIKPAPEFE